MPVPIVPEQLLDKINDIQRTFEENFENVERSVIDIDSADDESDALLKSQLRKEYARALATIQYSEQETKRHIKAAAVETLFNIKSEAYKAKQMKEELKGNSKGREYESQLLVKFEGLVEDVEIIRRNMTLKGLIDSDKFNQALRDAFSFKTKDFEPSMFELSTHHPYSSKPGIMTKNPNSFKSEFLLNAIQVTWSSVDPDLDENGGYPGTSRNKTLKNNLKGLIKNNLANMRDKEFIELNLPTGEGQLEVTLFGSYIKNGSQRLNNCGTADPDDTKFLNETCRDYINLESLRRPAAVRTNPDGSLDESDIRCLDITKRKGGSLGNGSAADAVAEVERIRPLAPLAEVTEPLNDSTPFSIVSEAQYSTMRETSAAKLAEMLASASGSVSAASASASAELVETETGIKIKDEVILAPLSETGRKSVEEMQKSLSTENSPSNSREIIDLDGDDVPVGERSILFATKTQIYQELATPQVKPDNKRYQVKEGKTKTTDGMAGTAYVSRSKKQLPSSQPEHHPQPPQNQPQPPQNHPQPPQNQPHQPQNHPQQPQNQPQPPQNQPKQPSNENSLPGNGSPVHSNIVLLDCGDDTRDKTVLEDSNEDADGEEGWGEGKEGGEPHPLDNSRWEDIVSDDRRVVDATALECTLWDLDKTVPTYCLTSTRIKVDKEFKSREDLYSNPTFMTHLARNKSILIVDSLRNRIGVYDEVSLEQKGWFPSSRSDIQVPLNILALSCGKVALIEKPKGISIYAYDGNKYAREDLIKGKFRGLAEGPDGSLISIEEFGPKFYVRIHNLKKKKFRLEESMELSVIQNKVTGMPPLPRYVVCKHNKLYISDPGSARLYIVDILTRSQEAFGSYGSGDMCFQKPLPVLVDDVGNICVGDQETGRLHIFDPKGVHIKKISYKASFKKSLFDFLWMGDCFYGSYYNGPKEESGIIRFSVLPRDNCVASRPDEFRVGSPLDILM